MSYKTVLVHVDQSRQAPVRIQVAAEIARAQHAHLVGAAMTGISRYVFDSGAFNPNDPTFSHHLEHLRHYARDGLDKFETLAKAAGVDEVEPRVVDDDAAGGIALQARYADLTVIGQFDPAEPVPGLMSNFPEHVMLHSGRPVLVVPFTGKFSGSFRKAIIAWDGGMAASRAIAGALPLLAVADAVDILIFSPEQDSDAHGEQPGADLALFLARHGVKANVHAYRIDIDTGNALLSAAADLGAELLVMGAYGHARFREVVLGGATRTVLSSMTVPVLMAH
jgi:nucleotide-binding universal stress UspA family protein